MKQTGRCYCGDLHYEFNGPVHSQILCHCRECRYLSGGSANASVVISEESLQWTKGAPKTYQRSDLETPAHAFAVTVEHTSVSKVRHVLEC